MPDRDANERFRRLVALVDTSRISRVEGWRYDLHLLAREIKRQGVAPFRKVSQEQFEAEVQEGLFGFDDKSHGILAQDCQQRQKVRAIFGTGERVAHFDEHESGSEHLEVIPATQFHRAIVVPIADPVIGPAVPDPTQPKVILRGRATTKGDRRLVSLFLVNDQETPLQNRDAAWLFQVALRVEAEDGTPIFLSRETEAMPEVNDPELPLLDLLCCPDDRAAPP